MEKKMYVKKNIVCNGNICFKTIMVTVAKEQEEMIGGLYHMISLSGKKWSLKKNNNSDESDITMMEKKWKRMNAKKKKSVKNK